jgi:DNA repair exonuclease SbcCD ATPase subunit
MMKRLSIVGIIAFGVVCMYGQINKKAAPKKPETASKLKVASECNLMYRDIVAKLCTDWRAKHGLAALYDLLPIRTPSQREFKKSVSEKYEKAFGRVPEKMPLALPRFERMKNRYRALVPKYNALRLAKTAQCEVQHAPVAVSCKDEQLQVQREISDRTQQLNDSIVVATKSIIELSTKLGQHKTSDKELSQNIADLSKQLQSLTSALEKSKSDATKKQDSDESSRKALEALKNELADEKEKIEQGFKEKLRSITDQLLETSKRLSEATFQLQEKKGEPGFGKDDFLRINDQLTQVSDELTQQRNQTAQEQKYAQVSQQSLDELKSALSDYVSSEQLFLAAYNNFKEILTATTDYSSESIKSIVDVLKTRWSNYTNAVNHLNAILRTIGMADVLVEPNECYNLMNQSVLLATGSSNEEALPAVVDEAPATS